MAKMYRFRATVWHLSSVAAAVEGDAGTSRFITEDVAESPDMFDAIIKDRYLHDVDAEVTLGPITCKGPVTEHD
jgi:hypothetical protein